MEAAAKTMKTSGSSEMDCFLQRMRSNLMYELRNIQHGEKSVTGQNRREKIQKFMEEHVCPGDNAGTSSEREIQRPEAVVIEVQGVIEQRRVSSVLQSDAFRRQLENVIRGSIQSTQRQINQFVQPILNRSSATVLTTSSSSEITVSPGQRPLIRSRTGITGLRARSSLPQVPAVHVQDRQEIPSNDTVSVTPRQSLLTRHDSSESISTVDSFSSARSSVDFDDLEESVNSNVQNESVVHEQNRGFERQHLADVGYPVTEAIAQEHSLSPEVNRQNGTDMQHLTWNDINRVQREELVEEISDLLHDRLVSSTLDGEFRATLELMVQDRVTSTGTNGAAVQNFIQALPRGGIVQNDFSHLGIPNTENDNISVTGFSAHSVPYTQTNTHMSREIQNLKSQMLEMKNMMKLTFDLQMDIQRAIRQEVAAAMQPVTGQRAIAVPIVCSQPVNDTHCLICLDRHSDSVLYQCGHMCVCYICGKDLVSRNHGCPVCRAPIKDVIRAYKTNTE